MSVATAAVALALPVRADPTDDASALALDWSAPAECPTRDDVVHDITRLLGPIEGTGTTRALKARARITQGADGRWRVRIQTMGPGGGERRLDAASCDALAKATALVLALRINPNLPLPQPEPPPPPPAPPPPPPTPTPIPTPVPAPTPPEPPPAPTWMTGAVSVGPVFLLTLGEEPRIDEAAGIVVGLGPPLLHGARIEAHGEVSVLHQHPSAGSDLGGGSAWSAGGGARGCYGPTFRTLTLLGCAGADAETMSVAGSGSSKSLTQNAVWATVEAGGEARWAVSPWFAIHLDLTALLPIAPPKFVVEDPTGRTLGIVSQPAPVWGRLGFGAELTFF